ncbi:hypothetical protein ACE09Y_06800 [Raphidiopsis sp. BLCC-F218]
MIWILVAEDDYYLTESLIEALTMEGFRCWGGFMVKPFNLQELMAQVRA